MSITWARLEPRVRPDSPDGNLARAVKAAVHDPLWLLCRQWQLGEFQGEDGGTPVVVQAGVVTSAITQFTPHGGEPRAYDGSEPLEPLVEREPLPSVSLRARADAGRRFLLVMARSGPVPAALRARLVADYTLTLPDGSQGDDDRDAASFLALMAPRVPDGRRIATALRSGDLSDPRAVAVKTEYLEWYDANVEPPAGECWLTEKLEYRFSVAGALDGEEVTLTAPEYTGGGLDWYHLDRVSPPGQTGVATSPAAPLIVTAIPGPAAYPGMPVERFWQIEDARVNLPAIEADPVDLSRMLLIEFATVYGNDWWVVPVDVPFGNLARIVTLTAATTFGDTIDVKPIPHDGWHMFSPSDRRRTEGTAASDDEMPLLVLLPVLADRQQSDPIEEVLLFRDELANMAWGVEHAVENQRGRRRLVSPAAPVTALADAEALAPPAGSARLPLPFASLMYVLTGSVPSNWHPLVPVHEAGSSHRILLRRGRVARFAADGSALPHVKAAGRFLGASKRVEFPDEEVPRSGRRLQRLANHARWRDGRVVTWLSRRVRAGRGEGASGLQFDVAREPEQRGGER